jgi:ubiquinone/menaquinone biosynthesis C-methylase UbiE
MMDALSKWLDRLGEETLRQIDFGLGKTFLDFGCGSGNYTIPLAKLFQEKGIIYALDQDTDALDELEERSKEFGLTNIRRLDSTGDVEIPLEKNTVDVVLLYDVFWYFPLGDPRLDSLLTELRRVLTPKGLLSIFPTHIDTEKLTQKIKLLGYAYHSEFTGQLFHYSWLEEGQIQNYQVT